MGDIRKVEIGDGPPVCRGKGPPPERLTPLPSGRFGIGVLPEFFGWEDGGKHTPDRIYEFVTLADRDAWVATDTDHRLPVDTRSEANGLTTCPFRRA